MNNSSKDNAELIAWIHSQLEIARNRTYPYSAETENEREIIEIVKQKASVSE